MTQLSDSTDAEQHINAEKKKLKTKNIVSAILFVALGIGVFYLCSTISGLIVEAGRKFEVPVGDIHKAVEPYASVRISSIALVAVGMAAYINFIIGNIKTGIYVIAFSMMIPIFLLFIPVKNFGKEDLELYSLLLSPLLIVALNSIRMNYFGNKRINNVEAS